MDFVAMSPADIVVLLLLGTVAGALIGCVGIGGVILVPLLFYLCGIPIQAAIAGAMFAYILAGIVGCYVYARHGSIQWASVGWLWVGAIPAAALGAISVSLLKPWHLELCIALLCLAAGIHALTRQRGEGNQKATEPALPAVTAIGAITGFTSALTGTGGPLVLIPILMWLRLEILTAIGLAQAIQPAIALSATIANIYTDQLDIVLGLALGVGIAVGTWGGGKLAHSLPREQLRRMVAMLMIIVGAFIIAKLTLMAPAAAIS